MAGAPGVSARVDLNRLTGNIPLSWFTGRLHSGTDYWGVVRVTGDSINVRSGAGASTGKLGVATKGQLFERRGDDAGGWTPISYKGKDAWIAAQYAAAVKEAALMDDLVITAGKYAGAIMAVVGVITALAWKPITTRRQAKRAKAEADRKGQQDFQSRVLGMLGSISEDVGDLQCDRLTQAHDYYMGLGCCPSATKQVLVHMHRSYRAKGRNHLCDHYEQDILDLSTDMPARAE